MKLCWSHTQPDATHHLLCFRCVPRSCCELLPWFLLCSVTECGANDASSGTICGDEDDDLCPQQRSHDDFMHCRRAYTDVSNNEVFEIFLEWLRKGRDPAFQAVLHMRAG